MSLPRSRLALLLPLLLTGCLFGRRSRGAPTTPAAPAPAAAMVVASPMSATLAGVASPVSGTAELKPGATPHEIRATVRIKGSVVGLVHPWALRSGRCGEAGPVLGPAAAYTTLDVGPDGTAEATTTLPVPMPLGTAHSVTVMRSRSDSTVIACGLLTPGA
ncbi:MAG TPA: hypothetical protein VFS08_02285 [Gemmatimonadaceae bacterium]|nr:hypothetical protein [Gemmatimonadaceae bacterium]